MRLLSFFAFLLFVATSAPAAVPPPPPAAAPDNVWHLDLSNGGRVSIQLRPDVTPAHVERIKTLTRRGFYDGLIFHRVVEGFMAQGGDPQGTGAGGSDLPNLPAEINGLPHVRGAVGMARTQDPNSANSQFYIMFVPRLGMDQEYTVFGRVIGGMNFVDSIERGEPPLRPTRIIRASIGSDNVPPMTAAELRAAGERAADAADAAASAAAASFAVPASPPAASSEIAAPAETPPAIDMAAPAPEAPRSEAADPPPADSPPAMPMVPPASPPPAEAADVPVEEAPPTTGTTSVEGPEPVDTGAEQAEGPTEAEREPEPVA